MIQEEQIACLWKEQTTARCLSMDWIAQAQNHTLLSYISFLLHNSWHYTYLNGRKQWHLIGLFKESSDGSQGFRLTAWAYPAICPIIRVATYGTSIFTEVSIWFFLQPEKWIKMPTSLNESELPNQFGC